MKALFLDYETTGIDPATALPIELAVAIVDCETYEVEDSKEMLILGAGYPKLSDEIVRVTHITDDMLIAKGVPPKKAHLYLNKAMGMVDYVVAYNIAYDQAVYKAESQRHGHEMLTPWICALTEPAYPDHFQCRKLSHLALDHGIVVQPKALHRAMGDVLLTIELLKHGKYRFSDIVARAAEETVVLQAKIAAPWNDGGKGKDAAKKLGYAWESPRGTKLSFPKLWVKKLKASEVEKEIAKAPFLVDEVWRGKA